MEKVTGFLTLDGIFFDTEAAAYEYEKKYCVKNFVLEDFFNSCKIIETKIPISLFNNTDLSMKSTRPESIEELNFLMDSANIFYCTKKQYLNAGYNILRSYSELSQATIEFFNVAIKPTKYRIKDTDPIVFVKIDNHWYFLQDILSKCDVLKNFYQNLTTKIEYNGINI
jgi:hypothetical protein